MTLMCVVHGRHDISFPCYFLTMVLYLLSSGLSDEWALFSKKCEWMLNGCMINGCFPGHESVE